MYNSIINIYGDCIYKIDTVLDHYLTKRKSELEKKLQVRETLSWKC